MAWNLQHDGQSGPWCVQNVATGDVVAQHWSLIDARGDRAARGNEFDVVHIDHAVQS